MNYIDIEKSYVYLNSNLKNSWRVSIKSILHDIDENTEYYLTKECRAEALGINPFDHKSNSEFLTVVDNKKNRWSIRNIPIFKFNQYGSHYHHVSEKKPGEYEININKVNYKLINFDEVNSQLKTKSLDCLYSKIYFKYKKKNYFIFNKVEYINFDGEKHNDSEYVQPIYGYVPFVIGDKVKVGYAVRYLEKNKEGELEFKLRTNQRINKFLPPVGKNLFISFLTRIIISFLFFPIKISEFGEKINIKQSKIEFFKRMN